MGFPPHQQDLADFVLRDFEERMAAHGYMAGEGPRTIIDRALELLLPSNAIDRLGNLQSQPHGLGGLTLNEVQAKVHQAALDVCDHEKLAPGQLNLVVIIARIVSDGVEDYLL